jgi:chemotaxis-related protein WspD
MPEQVNIASGAAPITIHDCWNTIGVRGDGSCPELSRHVHCRNCPVYAAAAVGLLDRDLPPDYLAEWSRLVARQREVEHLDTQSVVIFRIGAEWLALPTLLFEEVAELRTVHSLPHRRGKIVMGLANVRGELLVCVSLGDILGLEHAAKSQGQRQHTQYRRLLVVSREAQRVAFPVDEVQGIVRFHRGEQKEVPTTVSLAATIYTGMLSWQDRSVGLLDDQLLLSALNRSLA